jgi:hypothetical protein
MSERPQREKSRACAVAAVRLRERPSARPEAGVAHVAFSGISAMVLENVLKNVLNPSYLVGNEDGSVKDD